MFDVTPYRQELERLCKKYGVKELALFGSALGDDFEPGRSDIDFVVKFSPRTPVEHKRAYFGFIEDLESLLSRRVDLVELDVIRNPYLKEDIESSQEAIYVASE